MESANEPSAAFLDLPVCQGTEVGAPQYTVEELTALVDEAHSRGLKVASHAHGSEGIVNALKAGVDTIGRLAPGHYADVIAVPGNPLLDLTLLEAPTFVMKEGVVYLGNEAR